MPSALTEKVTVLIFLLAIAEGAPVKDAGKQNAKQHTMLQKRSAVADDAGSQSNAADPGINNLINLDAFYANNMLKKREFGSSSEDLQVGGSLADDNLIDWGSLYDKKGGRKRQGLGYPDDDFGKQNFQDWTNTFGRYDRSFGRAPNGKFGIEPPFGHDKMVNWSSFFSRMARSLEPKKEKVDS